MPISNPTPIQQLETTAFGRSLINQPNGDAGLNVLGIQPTSFGKSFIAQLNRNGALQNLGFANLPTDSDSINPEVVVNDTRNGFTYKPRLFHAKAFRTTNQAIPNSTVTAVSFSETAYHPLVSSSSLFMINTNTPTRLTIRQAGVYLVVGQVFFEDNASGSVRLARIQRTSGGISSRLAENRLPAMSVPALSICLTHNFIENDFIELAVFQNSGSSLSVQSGTYLSISQLHI